VEQERKLERHVRTILRRARAHERLEQLQIVHDLCAGLGISNASAMVRELVNAAFGETPHEKKLKKIVFDCDIDGTMTQEGSARSLGISNRQFFRLRAQAVRAIAQTATRILYDTSDESLATDDLEQLARSLAASRPGAASQVFSLLASSSVSTRFRAMRARIDAGIAIDEQDLAHLPDSSRPTALVLFAQSHLLRGDNPAAVQMVLQEVGELASRPGSGYDDTTRFELELLHFFRARTQDDAIAMRSSARNLVRLSGERSSLLLRATAASAEAAVRCGDFFEARRQIVLLQAQAAAAHNVRYLGVASLTNAQLLFIESAHANAATAARAARVALAPYPPFAFRAEVLLGRIAVASGTMWTPETPAGDFGAESREKREFSIVYARHLVQSGSLDLARTYAIDAADHAKANEFRGLYAHALVTLGAIDDLQGDETRAQANYTAGILELSGVFDLLATYDFFAISALKQRTFGPLTSIDPVVEGLLMRLQRSIPDLMHAGSAIEVWRRFIRALLSLDDSALRDVYRHPSVYRSICKYRDVIEDAVALSAAPILPNFARERFIECTSEALSGITAAARTAG
jgi:hypothetical protein